MEEGRLRNEAALLLRKEEQMQRCMCGGAADRVRRRANEQPTEMHEFRFVPLGRSVQLAATRTPQVRVGACAPLAVERARPRRRRVDEQ